MLSLSATGKRFMDKGYDNVFPRNSELAINSCLINYILSCTNLVKQQIQMLIFASLIKSTANLDYPKSINLG